MTEELIHQWPPFGLDEAMTEECFARANHFRSQGRCVACGESILKVEKEGCWTKAHGGHCYITDLERDAVLVLAGRRS